MDVPPEIAAKLREAGLDPSDPNVLAMLLGMQQGRKQKPDGFLPAEDCLPGRDEVIFLV
jgi:hypothetical protein